MTDAITKREVVRALQEAARAGCINTGSYQGKCWFAHHYLLGYLGSMLGLSTAKLKMLEGETRDA